MIVAAEIVCCSLDGSSCSRKYKGASGADICRSEDGYHLWENPGDDDRKVTWNEANLHCLSEGKRLCNSQEELDKCCKTGCFYDNQLVWSSVKEDCIIERWDNLKDVRLTASTEWDNRYKVENIRKPNTKPWHGRGKGKNQWIAFNFRTVVKLSGFRYKAHTGWDGSSFNNFKFEYWSNNGTGWNIFHEGQGPNLDCCEWRVIDFHTSPSAKSFRLFMIDDWGYKWLSIEQLQLKTINNCNSNR